MASGERSSRRAVSLMGILSREAPTQTVEGRLGPVGRSRCAYQGIDGIPGPPEQNDRFANSLAAGDFNGDSLDDLAIGVPGEAFPNTIPEAGVVHVLFGTSEGLRESSSLLLSQDGSAGMEAAEAGHHFGWAPAARNFDGNDVDDLVIGVRDESVLTSEDRSGAIHLLSGKAGGFDSPKTKFWHEGELGVPGGIGAGSSVAAAWLAGAAAGAGGPD